MAVFSFQVLAVGHDGSGRKWHRETIRAENDLLARQKVCTAYHSRGLIVERIEPPMEPPAAAVAK